MEPDRWKQLEGLYHAALDRPPEKRSRFLQTACEGDDALRQEVQSLLSQSDVRDFLDGPTAVTPGSRLGSYDILAAIGKGGMGEVWKAVTRSSDVRSLSRRCPRSSPGTETGWPGSSVKPKCSRR